MRASLLRKTLKSGFFKIWEEHAGPGVWALKPLPILSWSFDVLLKPVLGEVVQCVYECVFLLHALPHLPVTIPSLLILLSSVLTMCLMGLANWQCAAFAAPRCHFISQICLLFETNQNFSLFLPFSQSFLLNSAQRRALWNWTVAWPNWYTTLDKVYSGWDWKQIRLNWCSRWISTLNFFALLKPQKQSNLLNCWI